MVSRQSVNEIAAGSVGGVAQVLVGQPFDTVKVRMQSSTPGTYSGVLDCLRRTVSADGPLALYKGTLSPLMGIAFCVSIQFAVLEETKRQLCTLQRLGSPSELPLSSVFLAGGIAGVANGVVSGPVEHVRTRMQVQSQLPASAGRYSGTIDCYRSILSQYGLRGLYQGQVITTLREFNGYAAYFMAYEMLVRASCRQRQCRPSELPATHVMAFGALAGYAMWLPVFPLDTVKSRIQTDNLDPAKRQYRGWIDALRQIVRTEGVGALYRGLMPCMLRAAPANAVTFMAYEMAMRWLGARD